MRDLTDERLGLLCFSMIVASWVGFAYVAMVPAVWQPVLGGASVLLIWPATVGILKLRMLSESYGYILAIQAIALTALVAYKAWDVLAL